MTPDTTHLLSFSKSIPGLQAAWDSTSLGLLKECPRKYYYSILEGWTPRRQNDHLTFGLHYHKALEIYDHKRAEGLPYDDAVDEAVQYCLKATIERLPNGSWRPWSSEIPEKNRESLLRSVVWYLTQFEVDPAKTVILANGKPAVELSFRYELGSHVGGEPVFMCGHLDRVVEFNSEHYILDRKTTKSYLDDSFFLKFNPDNQMTNYSCAGQVVYKLPVKGVIIDGAQVLVTMSRFLRGFTTRHTQELKEWIGETGYWISQAEYFAESGLWPKNDKSCGNYGGCPFRPVCAANPPVRDRLLSASFVRRVWDPLQVRGDI